MRYQRKEKNMKELNRILRKGAMRTYILIIVVAGLILPAGLSILSMEVHELTRSYKELSEYTMLQLQTGDYYALSDTNMIIDAFAEDSTGGYFILYRPWDNKWMSLYLKGPNRKEAEAIAEENREYLNDRRDDFSSRSISVKGCLKQMDLVERGLFTEWMQEAGFSDDEIYSVSDFRTLNTSDTLTTDDDALIGVIIGAFMTLVPLALLIVAIRGVAGGYQKEVLARIEEKGISPERISAELAQGTNYKNVTVTPSFALILGTNAKIIFLDDLIWVYGQTQTTIHKIYGLIPSGNTVTHNVIFVDRRETSYTAACKNEDESGQIIKHVISLAPYALSGYSADIALLAKVDFAGIVRYVDENRTSF